MKYTAKELKNWSTDRENKETGQWLPARPIPYESFIERLKNVWKVLIGEYDVLNWE